MAFQVFLGFAWVAVLIGGLVGIRHAPALAGVVLTGVIVKKFLEARRNPELNDGRVLGLEEPVAPFRPSVLNPVQELHRKTGWTPAGSSYASISYTPRRLARR
jgi:hypothetical protein